MSRRKQENCRNAGVSASRLRNDKYYTRWYPPTKNTDRVNTDNSVICESLSRLPWIGKASEKWILLSQPEQATTLGWTSLLLVAVSLVWPQLPFCVDFPSSNPSLYSNRLAHRVWTAVKLMVVVKWCRIVINHQYLITTMVYGALLSNVYSLLEYTVIFRKSCILCYGQAIKTYLADGWHSRPLDYKNHQVNDRSKMLFRKIWLSNHVWRLQQVLKLMRSSYTTTASPSLAFIENDQLLSALRRSVLSIDASCCTVHIRWGVRVTGVTQSKSRWETSQRKIRHCRSHCCCHLLHVST